MSTTIAIAVAVGGAERFAARRKITGRRRGVRGRRCHAPAVVAGDAFAHAEGAENRRIGAGLEAQLRQEPERGR